jgi:GMP synthase (glutamine-hydrolysing)
VWFILLFLLQFLGPGLAVRILCAEEPYMEKDFTETSLILKLIVDFSNAIKKVNQCLFL